MKESAIEILKQRMISKNTLLCCGLDPDLSKLPHDYSLSNLKDDERIIEFLRQIVDITSKYVCAYKIQKAFFDKFPFGHNHLKEIIAYIHKNHAGIPIILDCKIGDIDNTMKVYLDNIFGNLQADGVVVNPYMGDDVMVPLAQYPDKAIVVLVKTSNPGGKIVQDVELKEGHPLWQHILQLTVGRWNSANNMIPVVSSTVGLNMKNIREMIPDNMPILLAGVGAQGGSYTDIADLLNSKGIGVFVNSSRGIIYPSTVPKETWQDSVKIAVIGLKDNLNKARNK